MKAYWITFIDGSKGCCEGQSEYDAKVIAEQLTDKTVAGGKYKDFEVVALPYPTTPLIWQFDHPVVGKCPPFCSTPEQCKGKGACPKEHSCTE